MTKAKNPKTLKETRAKMQPYTENAFDRLLERAIKTPAHKPSPKSH
jgi:hypothetical protein